MPIDFYQLPGSAPCRAVALTASTLGVELNHKLTNLMNGDHLKPEFLKINPQHTIPTIVDNGFILWESRAIMMYLADQYGKDDKLYPKDPKKRAVVNQRMLFDMGTLYQAFADYYYPIIFFGAPEDKTKFEKLGTALSFLETFLEGKQYAAGDHLTLADLTLIATMSNMEVVEYDLSKYKNINRWFAKVKSEIPKYEEIVVPGLKAFKELYEAHKKK